MNIQISGDTSFYTDIVVQDANGEVVFSGNLKLEPDWWVLYNTRKDYMGDVVKKWAGRRYHLTVLADAIREIARAQSTPQPPAKPD